MSACDPSRVSRVLRVITTWSALEPKIRNCPRLLFPAVLRHLTNFRPPPLGFTVTVAPTRFSSPTTTRLLPPPSPHHAEHIWWQVQNRRSNRERRLWYAISIPVSPPDVLIPLQVQYTSVRIQWPGRRSLSNSSQPSPVTAPSDKNQRYTRPSPVLLVYPGLCGLESTGISMS